MRQVHRAVNVLTDANGTPSKLNGSRKPVNVRHILDFWSYGGRWWVGEPPRDYYLLELETGVRLLGVGTESLASMVPVEATQTPLFPPRD